MEQKYSAQRLLVLVGLAGSGKTALATALAEKGWEVVRQDGPLSAALTTCAHILSSGREVVVDRCNCTTSERRQWTALALRLLGPTGVSLQACTLHQAVHVCADALLSRSRAVDSQKVANLLARQSKAFQPVDASEGFAEAHSVHRQADAEQVLKHLGHGRLLSVEGRSQNLPVPTGQELPGTIDPGGAAHQLPDAPGANSKARRKTRRERVRYVKQLREQQLQAQQAAAATHAPASHSEGHAVNLAAGVNLWVRLTPEHSVPTDNSMASANGHDTFAAAPHLPAAAPLQPGQDLQAATYNADMDGGWPGSMANAGPSYGGSVQQNGTHPAAQVPATAAATSAAAQQAGQPQQYAGGVQPQALQLQPTRPALGGGPRGHQPQNTPFPQPAATVGPSSPVREHMHAAAKADGAQAASQPTCSNPSQPAPASNIIPFPRGPKVQPPGAVAETDPRPILLFDLNGTLTQHTAAKRSSGRSVMRPGTHHLLRLLGSFRLGIFSSASEFTVSRVLPMLRAAAAAGGNCPAAEALFNERSLIFDRRWTKAAPDSHRQAGGKEWDTVKPLGELFASLERVLLVDDDAFKAVQGEQGNMVLVPCWQNEDPTDTCIPLLVDALLATLGPLPENADLRHFSAAVSHKVIAGLTHRHATHQTAVQRTAALQNASAPLAAARQAAAPAPAAPSAGHERERDSAFDIQEGEDGPVAHPAKKHANAPITESTDSRLPSSRPEGSNPSSLAAEAIVVTNIVLDGGPQDPDGSADSFVCASSSDDM